MEPRRADEARRQRSLPHNTTMMTRWGGEYEEVQPTLHHVPGTISSPILQVLIELGLREKVEVKTLTFPELKQAAHLAVNPMGTSPAFQDGEVRIWESQAVLTHLLEMHDTSHRLHPPPRTSKRVKHLHLQTFLMATVYPHVASLYLHTLKPAEEQDATYVSASKSKWTQTIAPVLVDALADQPYLLGDEISAVDLVIAKPLRNADSLGLLVAFPTLDALFRRIAARPSFAQAYAVS